MPFLHRALDLYAAARGILAPTAHATAPAMPAMPAMPANAAALAKLVRDLVTAKQPPPVQPAFEAQRLATANVEPSVRTYLRWTPSDLTAALQMADGGNLRMAADLCEAILGDDRANAVLNTRVNAVLGSDLTFEAGRGRRKRSAVKALEADEDWYASWSESVLGQMLLWGRLLGVSPAQQNWAVFPDHGGRQIPVVENWHAQHLRLDPICREWRIRVGETFTEVPIRPGDGKWILFMPYGSNRPWAHGLWRGFARLWLLKQYALDDWGKHSEAHGNPLKLGIPPKVGEAGHGNKELRQQLADDIAQLGANSALVLPPGFDFRLVEATANTWEMFRAQIDMANNAMSVMAIGTNLPTEVGTGAATGATAQNLVRIDYKKADAEALSTMAHDQNLVWWAEFNFGDRGLAPWPIWDVVPPADAKAKADVLSTFANAIDKLTEANVPVDITKLAEEFEVPLRAVDDARVQSPRIFEYHLKYGILKKNEIRASLGYEPEVGGDVIPEPIVQVPGTRPVSERSETDALSALAEAHNAAHDEPSRQTTAEVLLTVWGRGASLATGADRDAWAMGRVEAFLRLLADGEPTHPAYVADNDLLPDGHERRLSVAALGSPNQPRDDHGKWTDGPGGGRSPDAHDAARSGEPSPRQSGSAQRTKSHERLEQSERQAAEKAERRAAKLEERAKLSEAKARAARERADVAQKKVDELELSVDARQSDVDDAEDALDKAKAERSVTEKHRADVREAEKARDEAEKAFSSAERRSEHLVGEADERKWSAESHRDMANEAADIAKARREHADMMSASTDRYASTVAKRHARAKVELDEATKRKDAFEEELKRLHEDRRVAIEEAGELVYNKNPDIRSSPAAEAALARERAADERWEAAFDKADSVRHAPEHAARMERYWREAARKADAAVHDGPIDGDGDGKVNEDDDDDDD